MKYLKLLFSGITVFLFSCSNDSFPDNILKPEKMQAVFWDYIRADVFTNEFIKKDSTKNPDVENARLQQQVFTKHKVSKETFYRSYDFYLKHQPLMKNLMDTMLLRQQKIIPKIKDTAAIKKYEE